MAENIITVRITVRRHAVAHAVQFFHGLALLNPAQIPFQTPVHIIQIRVYRLVQRIRIRRRRFPLYSGAVDQLRLLKPIHLTEDLRRVQSIGRFGDHTLFQSPQPSFNRILPSFIRNVKKIREYLNLYRPSIAVAKSALKLPSGLLKLLRIWLSVIVHILQGVLFLPEFFRHLTDRYGRFRQLLGNIIHGCFQMCPQLIAGLFCHLSAGEIIDQLQGAVAHIIRGGLVVLPAFQAVYYPAPVGGTVRKEPDRVFRLLKFLLLLAVITVLKFCLHIDQTVSERCKLLLHIALPLLRLLRRLFRLFQIIPAGGKPCPAALDVNIFQNRLRMELVCPDAGQLLIRLMDSDQHPDPVLQIVHSLPDLPVSPQLFTDHGNCILPAPGKHIITDKLTCSARHPKRNGALLHSDHPPRLHIAEDHIVERVQICFL